MYKVDLHTHSVGSPDGGLSMQDYKHMLERGGLDFIAITDHNIIDLALALQKQFGNEIIVGEEVTTREGELIGLYLCEAVPAGLSALETAKAIHEQGGLVYVPHPFETVRKGLPLDVLDEIAKEVDIIETHNGRAIFQNRSAVAEQWAEKHNTAQAASSDAHGKVGWGKTYSIIVEAPTCNTLTRLLRQSTHKTGSPGIRGVLYPKLNRAKKKIRHA